MIGGEVVCRAEAVVEGVAEVVQAGVRVGVNGVGAVVGAGAGDVVVPVVEFAIGVGVAAIGGEVVRPAGAVVAGVTVVVRADVRVVVNGESAVERASADVVVGPIITSTNGGVVAPRCRVRVYSA